MIRDLLALTAAVEDPRWLTEGGAVLSAGEVGSPPREAIRRAAVAGFTYHCAPHGYTS